MIALRHGTLLRTLHAERPSERIDWTAGHLRLLHEPVDWARHEDGQLESTSNAH